MFDIRIIVMLAITMWVTGCAISNDDIIEEVKKCEDAGFKAKFNYNYAIDKVRSIVCVPLLDVKKGQSDG